MNPELTKYDNKAKGDEYEELVAQYYANEGYIVIKNGFIAEKYDKGVDLIAIRLLETKAQHLDSNNKLSRNILKITTTYEIILIQCKRFESKSEYSLIVDTIETAQKNNKNQYSIEAIFKKMEEFESKSYIFTQASTLMQGNSKIKHYINSKIKYRLIVPHQECIDKSAYKYIYQKAKNNYFKHKFHIFEIKNQSVQKKDFKEIRKYFEETQ